MQTDIWFRNPWNYIRELAEVDATSVVWDRGTLIKRKVDPVKHANLYFGKARWRSMVLGTQGATMYLPGDSFTSPSAVYPVWDYTVDSTDDLEDIVFKPPGQNQDLCMDLDIPDEFRPVYDQKERLVIVNYPKSAGPMRQLTQLIMELKAERPALKVHLHGSYGFSIMMGMGYDSADFQPRDDAAHGRVILPNGKKVNWEYSGEYAMWLHVLGFKKGELSVPRNRCMFNIKSAMWAGAHYTDNLKFKTTRSTPSSADIAKPKKTYRSPVTKNFKGKQIKTLEGDLFLCKTCRLMNTCKYFREDAVCAVPGSDAGNLAKYFNTRDVGTITDGLSILTGLQAKRVSKAVAAEEEEGVLNPEVTKMIHGLMNDGLKLAKLLNPELNGGTKVQVNVGMAPGGATQVAMGSPKQVIAGIVREFEMQGISRSEITTEMVQGVFKQITEGVPQQLAIEGEVISHEDD